MGSLYRPKYRAADGTLKLDARKSRERRRR